MLGFILMPIIVNIEKIVFLERNASKKREITQIKCWIELSSLVNKTGSTLSTSVLSFKLIALIVIEILFILKQYPKFLCTIPKQGQITLVIQITGSPSLL